LMSVSHIASFTIVPSAIADKRAASPIRSGSLDHWHT
jgi:hypothetical protein